MNKYRKALARELKCTGAVRQRLLGRFDQMVDSYQEENDTMDLEGAFGPPETMARFLMEKITDAERRQYRTQKALKTALCVFLVTLFLLNALGSMYTLSNAIDISQRVSKVESPSNPGLTECALDFSRNGPVLVSAGIYVYEDENGNIGYDGLVVSYRTELGLFNYGWALQSHHVYQTDKSITLTGEMRQWGLNPIPFKLKVTMDSDGNFYIS